MSINYTALERLYGKRLFDETIDVKVIPASSKQNAIAYANELKEKAMTKEALEEVTVSERLIKSDIKSPNKLNNGSCTGIEES